jgi:hypothetical protein
VAASDTAGLGVTILFCGKMKTCVRLWPKIRLPVNVVACRHFALLIWLKDEFKASGDKNILY